MERRITSRNRGREPRLTPAVLVWSAQRRRRGLSTGSLLAFVVLPERFAVVDEPGLALPGSIGRPSQLATSDRLWQIIAGNSQEMICRVWICSCRHGWLYRTCADASRCTSRPLRKRVVRDAFACVRSRPCFGWKRRERWDRYRRVTRCVFGDGPEGRSGSACRRSHPLISRWEVPRHKLGKC